MSTDPVTTFHTHVDSGKHTIVSRQDLAPIMREVARLKELDSQKPKFSSNRIVAQVGVVELDRWGKEDGINYFGLLDKDQSLKLYRRLNSNEFKKFRVWEGKLGKEDVGRG